jgi:formate hydrogenlyase subunit 3/multisubunit Na+/H+ antiporter MnhD subunit
MLLQIYILVIVLATFFLITGFYFRNKSQDEYKLGLVLISLALSIVFFGLAGVYSFDITQTFCEIQTNDIYETYIYGNNFSYSNGSATYHWDYEASGIPPTADKGVFLFHKRMYYNNEIICNDEHYVYDGLGMFFSILAFLIILLMLMFTFDAFK